MTKIERDIRRWLGGGKTFKGQGETGVVRAILFSFAKDRPDLTEQLEILQTLATVCGFDGVLLMLGSAVCEGDGSRTLTLKAAP